MLEKTQSEIPYFLSLWSFKQYRVQDISYINSETPSIRREIMTFWTVALYHFFVWIVFWPEFWAWNFPELWTKGLSLSVHSKHAAKCTRYPNAAKQAVNFCEVYSVWKPASPTTFPSLLPLIHTLKYPARKAWKRRLEYYGTGHITNIRVWRAEILTGSLWGTMHGINHIATGACPERKAQNCKETSQHYHLLTNVNPWEIPEFTQLVKEGK